VLEVVDLDPAGALDGLKLCDVGREAAPFSVAPLQRRDQRTEFAAYGDRSREATDLTVDDGQAFLERRDLVTECGRRLGQRGDRRSQSVRHNNRVEQLVLDGSITAQSASAMTIC
jgi:hypothetical protein